MTGKGSLAASEIAYYANLPRTKIYQTIKKLEKKRLAVISKQKPLTCSAVHTRTAMHWKRKPFPATRSDRSSDGRSVFQLDNNRCNAHDICRQQQRKSRTFLID